VKQHLRIAIVAIAFLAGCVLLFRGFSPLWSTLPKTALEIEDGDRPVGYVVSGDKQFHTFTLTNTSAYPVCVLGTGGGCGQGGCVVTRTELPFSVPPYEARQLKVEYTASVVSGSFEYTLPIYTDWPTQNTMFVVLGGTVLQKHNSAVPTTNNGDTSRRKHPVPGKSKSDPSKAD
jgi:hypothetical protein